MPTAAETKAATDYAADRRRAPHPHRDPCRGILFREAVEWHIAYDRIVCAARLRRASTSSSTASAPRPRKIHGAEYDQGQRGGRRAREQGAQITPHQRRRREWLARDGRSSRATGVHREWLLHDARATRSSTRTPLTRTAAPAKSPPTSACNRRRTRRQSASKSRTIRTSIPSMLPSASTSTCRWEKQRNRAKSGRQVGPGRKNLVHRARQAVSAFEEWLPRMAGTERPGRDRWCLSAAACRPGGSAAQTPTTGGGVCERRSYRSGRRRCARVHGRAHPGGA